MTFATLTPKSDNSRVGREPRRTLLSAAIIWHYTCSQSDLKCVQRYQCPESPSTRWSPTSLAPTVLLTLRIVILRCEVSRATRGTRASKDDATSLHRIRMDLRDARPRLQGRGGHRAERAQAQHLSQSDRDHLHRADARRLFGDGHAADVSPLVLRQAVRARGRPLPRRSHRPRL